MYLLAFYVPETHVERIKKAVFDKGAGKFGKYDSCCFQTKGEGQFRPLQGSSPFIGKEKEIETVSEIKVEMIVEESLIVDVLDELVKKHPYEEVAYHYFKINT